MEETKKIQSYHLIFIIIISELMHQYTYMPILKSIPRNQDAWLQILLSIPYAIIICAPILFLLSKFKGVAFLDMLKAILGKTGSKIITFIFILFFCFCNISCLSLSLIFIRNYIFFNTPTYAILIFILAPICYISIKGLTTISRLSTLVIVGIISTIIFFLVFSLNKIDITLIMPILGDSKFIDLNIGAFISASRFSDILIIFVLAYRVNKQNKTNKIFFISYIVYTIITSVMAFSTISVLGVNLALQASNPYFSFTKQVDFLDFIQRIEALNMISWLSGSILKIAYYHYIMAFYLSKIFNTKTHKGFTIFSVILSFLIIIIFGTDKSYIMENLSSDRIFPWIVLFFILIVPIIILIVYLIRKKKINVEDYKMKENVGIIN